jgi:hypothetical protein
MSDDPVRTDTHSPDAGSNAERLRELAEKHGG